MKIETPINYMQGLNWSKDDLNDAQQFLKHWDLRDEKYYKNIHPNSALFDKVEREHYRNCVKFWEKKLNENKSP